MESILPQQLQSITATGTDSLENGTQTALPDSPDKCQLQLDACLESAKNVRKAMEAHRARIEALFRCRHGREIHETQAAFSVQMWYESIGISLAYVETLSGLVIEEEQQ